MIREKILLFMASFILFISCIATANNSNTLTPKVQQYISQLATEHGFNVEQLTTLFSQVHYDDSIIAQMNRPFESKPWYIYRKHFVTNKRIEAGVVFWDAHKAILEKTEKKYGIPANVIVAIIGVETFYGNNVGHDRVIDALSTLAFHYPKRSKFFTKELTQFLLMTSEQNLAPVSFMGSYAGAIGIPQFMPSTYRHYAISSSKTHGANLMNINDAIMSVANYLYQHHWQKNGVVATTFSSKGSIPKADYKRVKLRWQLSTLKRKGLSPSKKVKNNPLADLITLNNQGEAPNEYWMVFKNFKVIMSYNPRTSYAMAVYQLSEAIKQAHAKHHA
jgi:membrane-bound lytic murein transglycosylase B